MTSLFTARRCIVNNTTLEYINVDIFGRILLDKYDIISEIKLNEIFNDLQWYKNDDIVFLHEVPDCIIKNCNLLYLGLFPVFYLPIISNRDDFELKMFLPFVDNYLFFKN